MSHHDHEHNHDHEHEAGFLGKMRGLLHRIRGHSHEYSVESRDDRRRLLVCMGANAAYGALQLVMGLVVLQSMILVTDAAHNLSDVLSLGVPLIVIALKNRHIAASLGLIWLNYLMLILFLGWAVRESVLRITANGSTKDMLVASVNVPVIGEVNSGFIMAGLSGIGIAVNLLSVVILSKAKNRNLNMRSAFLHQFADLIASGTATVASLAIALTGERMIDPGLTIMMSAVLVWMVWPNFKESWSNLYGSLTGEERESHVH